MKFYDDMLEKVKLVRQHAEKAIADVPVVGYETAITELDNAVTATMLWQESINDVKDEIAKQKEEEIDQETLADLAHLSDQVGELQTWLMEECMNLKYEGGILPKKV